MILNYKPDIVIMDINIDGKLSGIEVAKKLKQLKTTFLFITSMKDKEFYEKAKQTTYIGYLIKPFDEVSLQSAIELELTRRQDKSLSEDTFKEWVADFVIEDSILIKHNTQLYLSLIHI